MQLKGERMPFGDPTSSSRPWRILFLLALIAGGVMLTRMVEAGRVEPLFLPTPTTTRNALSYQDEGRTHFSAGNLPRAIEAYQFAVRLSPETAVLWAELARIQTYSSALLPTGEQQRQRLEEARNSINSAVEADPENAFAWAIRILVYDWSASAEEERLVRDGYITEAETSVAQSNRLDPNSALALAFQAELMVDQQQFAPAVDLARQAVELDPTSLDGHRVYGTVLESNGLYRQAIDEYLAATEINPNLTFLYLRIGANYRRLLDVENALEYFERAAKINEQLGIQDPIPYLAIGRTYLQDGSFFIAARNLERAVALSPSDPTLLGFLGIVYFKARNYESAQEVLSCAVEGCGPEIGRRLLCEKVYGCDPDDPDDTEALQYGEEVIGLPLNSGSLEYYYTYASVLAYNDECDSAEPVFQGLAGAYGSDPIVAAIVAEGRALCSSSSSGVTPSATLTSFP